MQGYTKPELDKVNKAAIVFVHGAGYLANAHIITGVVIIENICFIIC
jgi:hypothetical protein